MLDIAGDIIAASASLAGLILVFFAASLSSFDAYEETQKGSVRWAYRRRAWPALFAFLAALASCGFALHAKATGCDGTASIALWVLVAAGVGVLLCAILAVLEIG